LKGVGKEVASTLTTCELAEVADVAWAAELEVDVRV
jgi:hypothetical protein